MPTRYFLKKELPGIKEGEEVQLLSSVPNFYTIRRGNLGKLFHIPHVEWTDWIDERDGRWKPETEYWLFDLSGEATLYQVSDNFCTADEKIWSFGNCFKDKSTAEKAASEVRKTLEKFHQDNQ